jgi:hypothetical protein
MMINVSQLSKICSSMPRMVTFLGLELDKLGRQRNFQVLPGDEIMIRNSSEKETVSLANDVE